MKITERISDSPSRSSSRPVGDPEDSSCDANASVNASEGESVVALVVRNPGEDHRRLPPPCDTCSAASLDASCDDAAMCLQITIRFRFIHYVLVKNLATIKGKLVNLTRKLNR